MPKTKKIKPGDPMFGMRSARRLQRLKAGETKKHKPMPVRDPKTGKVTVRSRKNKNKIETYGPIGAAIRKIKGKKDAVTGGKPISARGVGQNVKTRRDRQSQRKKLYKGGDI